jgi:hypothetical protein
MTIELATFILFLMRFDGGKARNYSMFCDHEMMKYFGIFKGLVS